MLRAYVNQIIITDIIEFVQLPLIDEGYIFSDLLPIYFRFVIVVGIYYIV